MAGQPQAMMSKGFENAARFFRRIPTYVRRTSTAQIWQLTPYVMMLSALATVGIVELQRRVQPESSRGHIVLILAGAGVGVAVAIFLLDRWPRRSSARRPAADNPDQYLAKVLILSAQIGVLLLPVSAYLAVWQSRYAQLEWPGLGFLDKRFVLCLYWTTIFTFLVLPPILWKVLGGSNATIGTDARSVSPPLRTSQGAARRTVGKVTLALIVAYFMYGPPWNLGQLSLTTDNRDEQFHPGPSQAINNHEQVHLGPLQAIDKGYLPDIGPAAQQYGPGFQIAMYSLMKTSGQFTLLGFRQAQATIDFIGYCLFAVIAFLVLDIPYALLAVLLSLTISPFHQLGWIGNNSLLIWGWPNPLRYMGSLILAVSLPSLLTSKTRHYPRLVATGIAWGLLIWISPENLMMGAMCSATLCALMWATDTAAMRKMLQDFAVIAAGVLLFWLPVAAFYLAHGRLAEYLYNVFHVGSQVLNGSQNTLPAFDILQSPYLSNLTNQIGRAHV